MRVRCALVLVAALVTGCSGSASGSGAAGSDAGTPSPPATSSPTPGPVPSLDLRAVTLPKECAATKGQEMTTERAGDCYLALANQLEGPLYDVLQAVRTHDLPTVHSRAESAIGAVEVIVKGLRTTGWPRSVAPACREMADGYARWVPPLEVLTRVGTQDEIDAAYEDYAEVRGGGLQRSPTGVKIRRGLGLPLAP